MLEYIKGDITEITPNKITFTGNITRYEGYATEEDTGKPYNIEATLELINNNSSSNLSQSIFSSFVTFGFSLEVSK